jgi:SAM-dependent methyltransferase
VSVDVEARLAQVYNAASPHELSKTYDAWASSYDADMLATGYAHPAVICGLTARFVTNIDAAILDAGVGTGNIGGLLHSLGYTDLHGLDMSPGMIDKARARGVYHGLHQGILGEKLGLESGTYDAIISTGTFTAGHAPASAFDELTRLLKHGGHIIFTMGTTVWTENGFESKLGALCQQGLLMPVWESAVYHPMPHSKTESQLTTKVHVYQRSIL